MNDRKIAMLAMIALACAGTAKADPITYIMSVTASGSLDGTAFTNQTVTIDVSANTSSVVPYHITTPVTQAGFYVPALGATVSVAGGATDSFTDSFLVGDAQSGAGAPDLYFQDTTANNEILSASDPFFSTYGLTTFFGPLVDSGVYSQTGTYGTAGGSLVITSVSGSVTSQAIPEPSSLILTALAGASALGFTAIRRKRAARRSVRRADRPGRDGGHSNRMASVHDSGSRRR